MTTRTAEFVRSSDPRLRPASELPFHEGDRLSQSEFHRLYEQTPDHVRAELIGGVVHMPSPTKSRHSFSHFELAGLIHRYVEATPGVRGSIEGTIILGADSELQPDAWLARRPEVGGRLSVNATGYFTGPPELVVEVADATVFIALGPKRDDYRRAGVREYLVVVLPESRLRSFDLEADREVPAESDGLWRSRAFPGLWLDAAALLAGDQARLLTGLRAGLASPEHTAFVAELAARRSAAGPSA